MALSLVPFAVLVAHNWHLLPPVTAGDYAHYLLHAQALADGRSYGDAGYIYTRFAPFAGPAAQPPGLPLVLTPIVAFAGADSPGTKWLMVAFAVLLLIAVARDLSIRGNAYCAAGAALITGIALQSWHLTSVVNSDVGFAAVVWLVIAAADEPGPWTYRRVLFVSLAGLVAMMFRLAGVALLPALLLYAIGKRRTRGYKPFIPLAVWGICALSGAMIIGGMRSYAALVNLDPVHTLLEIPEALFRYRLALFASELYPFAIDRANDAYHAVATILVIIGLISVARRWAPTFLGAFTLAYSLLLLVSEANETRYAMPLIPVFAYAMLWGTVVVVRRLVPTLPEAKVPRTGFVVAVVVGVMTCATLLRRPDPPNLLGNPDVHSLFTTLRRMRADSIRVTFTNPRVLTLETGIPAMVMFGATPQQTVTELRTKRITHVILGDVGTQPGALRRFQETIATYPNAFVEEYRNGSFVLYRFVPAAVPIPLGSG